MDDLVTAWLATVVVSSPPARALDLGCGLGTVLLLTAWRFPEARCVGIEAQELSASLARRSVAFDGASDRVEVRSGDFRDPALTPEGACYDLVTGTPPYFPSGTGTESDHVQRAPCRFEHRGGVEAYASAAARLLAPGGVFVACEAALTAHRVAPALEAAGLELERGLDVVPRAGKPPLIVVFAARRTGEAGPRQRQTLVVRDAHGQRTPELRALRGDLGMPP